MFEQVEQLKRRAFLSRTGVGLGAAALQGLLAKDLLAADPGIKDGPHHPPKIKRVIFLCMSGGPV